MFTDDDVAALRLNPGYKKLMNRDAEAERDVPYAERALQVGD